MSTAEIDAPTTAISSDAEPADPPALLSRTMRHHGRRRTRLLAVVSLLGAIGTTGVVVVTAMAPGSAEPLVEATDPAWDATRELSDALRELRPGGSRNAARPLAGEAAAAIAAATKRVEALDLPTSQTPVRQRALRTLRADAAWVDAVGSTLANPRSPRRAELSGLATTAATATSVLQESLPDARGTVGGTGRLLSATKPGA